MLQHMILKEVIERDIRFYEMALINPKGTQAVSCKQQYGRSWRKRAQEELERLERMLDELSKEGGRHE